MQAHWPDMNCELSPGSTCGAGKMPRSNTLSAWQLIDVILASGGDIIKFAGDAMQVVWRVPEGQQIGAGGVQRGGNDEACASCLQSRSEEASQSSHESSADVAQAVPPDGHALAEQVLRASRCCMAMLTQFHGFSPTPGVSLSLHMGIGAGNLDGFIVGGHLNKW